MFGFSGCDLFRGSKRDRVRTAQAVTKGILDGVVQPIAGAKVYNAVDG